MSQEIVKFFKREVPDNDIYKKRIQQELELIEKKNFTGYILNVIEILSLIEDIPHIIRGSAGSSLICYLTKITNIDPVKENICFSRFLNEFRESMPDVDFDFPYNLRDTVFERINNHFKNKVARISNHIMYRQKSALRKAVKEVDTEKTIKSKQIKNIHKLKIDPELKDNINKKKKELLNTFKCFSLHCGGIVIFDDNVPEELCLKKVKNTTLDQIKYNKYDVDNNDLFKIDILSNRGLAQLFDVSKTQIEDYDMNDLNVFNVLSKGRNIGITFAESPTMRKMFLELKPKSIEDIAKCLALVRPMAQDSKNQYIKNMINTNKIYNNLIFDDDAILYIKDLLGCTESTADTYRKAFSKNKQKQINIFKKLLDGFENKKTITDKLSNLKKYSFCKSHAYSYAKLVYCLAYQKLYNPKEFWLSTLNHCHSMYRSWVHYQCAKTHLQLTLGHKPWYIKNDTLISCNKKSSSEDDNKLTSIQQYKKYGYWISNEFIIDGYIDITNNHIKFKGLIACGRSYKRKSTFVTIGYKKDKFIELVFNHNCYFNNYDYVEGDGLITSISTIVVNNYKFYKL